MQRACVDQGLIIGGGIAGPVLAMFLQRIGAVGRVFEARSEAEGDGGAYLGVAPNGMNVLGAVGLADEVRAAGHRSAGFRFLNGAGRTIGAMDQRDHEDRYGAAMVMIRRSALHRVLVAAARARGIEVRFDARLVGLDEDALGVTARLAGGVEVRGDALFGCDGIRSKTRSLVLPDAPAPAYAGLVDYGGFVRGVDVPFEAGWNVMVFGRRAFFGAFAPGDGEVWWFHNGGAAEPSAALEPEARRAQILSAHAGDVPWIGELVRATPEILGPWSPHDLLSIPRWHRGRVCLLGDAAHATSPSAGQGASLALEDAMALTVALRDAAAPEAAFAAFERLRRARVERIVRQARRNGDNKAVAGPLARWFRDRALPLFLRFGASAQAEAYGHRIAWSPAA
ncbi:MAG: NAD(P)/FAD-dependent oxidoreductase [Nannocystaceae bacterium]